MLRRSLMLISLAVFVLAGAGIALAAAVKVDLLPYPVANPIEPDASGRAVLNYAKGSDKTVAQVNCWGLTPESEYMVYLKDGGWYAIGTFTTRKNGSGNLHVFLEGDHSGHLPVAVNNAANQTVLLGP